MKHIAILIGIVGLVFAAGEPMRWNLPVGVGMILAAWVMYELADRRERKEKGGDNNNSTMGNLLRQYTEGAPRKVWKVSAECPGCFGCIFYVSERKKAELGEFAYKCNRRNLTMHGYKLNELFVPMNFEDWRCGVSQFRFEPLQEKKPSAEEEARLARRAAKREARRVRNEAIIDLHLRGFANYEICARLNTSTTTVSVVIKEYKSKNQ